MKHPMGRAGFSLIEVVVAMIVLVTGVLGLASATGYVVRMVKLGDVTTERAEVQQSVIERLRATKWGDLASGADSIGAYNLSWTASEGSSVVKTIVLVTVGPGLRPGSSGQLAQLGMVADTFTFTRLN